MSVVGSLLPGSSVCCGHLRTVKEVTLLSLTALADYKSPGEGGALPTLPSSRQSVEKSGPVGNLNTQSQLLCAQKCDSQPKEERACCDLWYPRRDCKGGTAAGGCSRKLREHLMQV